MGLGTRHLCVMGNWDYCDLISGEKLEFRQTAQNWGSNIRQGGYFRWSSFRFVGNRALSQVRYNIVFSIDVRVRFQFLISRHKKWANSYRVDQNFLVIDAFRGFKQISTIISIFGAGGLPLTRRAVHSKNGNPGDRVP